MQPSDDKKERLEKPTFLLAVLPLLLTIFFVALQVFYFEDGSPHIPLAMGVLITAGFGWYRGYRWQEMQDGMFNVIHVALPAIFILYVIGMIISSWIHAGTVPYLVYWGLQVLSPGIFLFAACIICSIVSVATGTSWGTTGTMGLALIGIGEGLGVPMAMTAGAVVSGAFFGDKMSPLSDTTNFSPAVVGTDLFTHIRNMFPVTIPAMLVALAVYFWVGRQFAGGAIDQEALNLTVQTLDGNFKLNALLLAPAFLVMFLAIKKMPALPGLFSGVVFGALAAMIFQGASLHEVFSVLLNGYKSNTGIEVVDKLLSKGGIMSMNWTVTLILIALALGGVLEATRCLETILDTILRFADKQWSLLLSSMGSVLGIHLATGEIFLSMALPGRMFAPAFRGKGVHVSALSRTMEDGGTLAAPLIPWSAGGVFVATTLGVGTLAYLPWAIACWMSIFLDVVYALSGAFIPKATEEDFDLWKDQGDMVMLDGVIMPASRVDRSVLQA